MTPPTRSVLREGIVAGITGAVIVAIWFLALDVARDAPLLTPTALGTVVLHGVHAPAVTHAAALPIVAYTILHGLAFVGFGIIAASLIAVAEREPPVFAAFVILFAAFEVFFVGVVTAFDRSPLGALVWWAVLAGNLLASIGMLTYFFRLHRALTGMIVGDSGDVIGEGAIAGLLGAAIVAVWFLVVDAIAGTPFHTPSVLGTGFLHQTSPVAAVLLYTLAHGVAFVVFGIVASALIEAAEHQPFFLFALVILFSAFEVAFFGATMIAARWVLDELAGWTVLVGNVLAATVMLGYFFMRHRRLARRLVHAWAEEN